MKKKALKCLSAAALILAFGLLAGPNSYAGSKSMEATKRKIYKDDSGETMREAYDRRDAENKAYRKKMISNSEESVRLLKEIRDLLKQQNRTRR